MTSYGPWLTPDPVTVPAFTSLTHLTRVCVMHSGNSISASDADNFIGDQYAVWEYHWPAPQNDPTGEVAWSIDGLAGWKRIDSIYFHRVWIPNHTMDAIDYDPPDLPTGAWVERRGVATIVSLDWTARIRAAPNLDVRQATGGNLLWQLTDANQNEPSTPNPAGTVPAHAEINPSGPLVNSWGATDPIYAYPHGAGTFTLTGSQMAANPDPVTYADEYWVSFYHSIDIHGSTGLLYPGNQDYFAIDEVFGTSTVLQPRQYRVVYPSSTPPLRITQRDDGLSQPSGRGPRLKSGPNSSSSIQTTRSPRRAGGKQRYL